MAQENAGQKIWPALIRGPDVFVTSYDVGEVYHRGPLVPKRITIQLVGAFDDHGNVRLADFIDQLGTIQRALNERERLVSHSHIPRIEYKVVDLHHSDATVVLEPVALNPIALSNVTGYIDMVVTGFSDELRSIKRDGLLTDEPDIDRLEAYSRIGERRDNLISKVKIAIGRKPVTIDRVFKQNIHKILGPDEFIQGTISGMLEAVNFHNTNRFTVYPSVGPRKIAGTFDDSLRNKVKEGIGNFVTVIGKLRYKQWSSFPHGVVAEDLDIHEPHSALPTLSELRGAFAGMTGDKNSVEFIEQIRNESW